MLSGSKLKEDAVECVQVIALKLSAKFPEQGNLLRSKGFAVEMVSIRHFDTSMVTASNRLNRVRAHEFRNITANRHFGNIEFACQIVVCIMPSPAQYFQQFLASVGGGYMLAPPSVAL